jgi:hypothetical protein
MFIVALRQSNTGISSVGETIPTGGSCVNRHVAFLRLTRSTTVAYRMPHTHSHRRYDN